MATAASNNDEILEDFKITKDKTHEIGRGAYGTVYRGVRVSNNDPVAVKLMTGYKQYMNLDELAKEADMLRKIPSHENIVKMYDYLNKEYDDDGAQMIDLWLVTELCTLGNLKKYALKNDLSIKKKIDLMFQSTLAVQHLHNCKPEPIAHRDIKPENILITETSGKHVVRLCDFGCARAVFREKGRSMTMKSLAGTESYWAPEQHELHDGHFSYDKSVDNFSLGVSNLALLNCSKGSLMTPYEGELTIIELEMQFRHYKGFDLCLHQNYRALKSAIVLFPAKHHAGCPVDLSFNYIFSVICTR